MADSEDTRLSYADQLWIISPVTAPAIAEAVRWAGTAEGSRGLDAGCGAGCHLGPLTQAIGPSGVLAALDISADNLARAREVWESLRDAAGPAVDFVQGDIRQLPFGEHSFDWVWCADTLWPARVVNDPVAVVREFARVTRPGGKVCLLYWSGQALLPGYPVLEARLNAGFAEWAPYYSETRAEAHHMRAQTWLREAGLRQIEARTFLAEVRSPIGAAMRESLAACYAMFWEGLEGRVSTADWQACQRLCKSASPDFIADIPDYYAFVTYTLFSGVK